jgi:hypothetical protein
MGWAYLTQEEATIEPNTLTLSLLINAWFHNYFIKLSARQVIVCSLISNFLIFNHSSHC